MQAVLFVLNLVVSLASTAWAVVALVRPASLSGSSQISRGEIFYVRMYAARSIPFGVVAGFLPFLSAEKAVGLVLFTAAVIQIADVVIAIGRRERGMIVGASVAATVHVLCSLTLV